MMAVRLMSKWELRRLSKSVNAAVLPTMTTPTQADMGHCDQVYQDEIGEESVIVFRQDKHEGSISSIILRGATDNFIDDIERAVDDGVNNFKALTKVAIALMLFRRRTSVGRWACRDLFSIHILSCNTGCSSTCRRRCDRARAGKTAEIFRRGE